MTNESVVASRPLNRFLRIAVMAGVESAIQLHIDRGDDLNARDPNGFTLLMLSAARNKHAVCKLLLDAGADKELISPSGTTAHAIAVAAGARDAAAVLAPSTALIEVFDAPVPTIGPQSDRTIIPFGGHPQETIPEPSVASKTEYFIALSATEFGAERAGDDENAPDFDLFGWEPEEELRPPEADPSITKAASAIQAAISEYEPIDSSADWDDIDLYLPERSQPLARADDADAREKLRLLLLRAIREGSVPRDEVEELSFNDDRSANAEAETLLSMVVNDLGAEVDERFEYVSASENFHVFVRPDETSKEEEIVADALAFVDNLASRHAEPLRIYQKEFQREKLISAEKEVSLTKAMEIGLERALDALASWRCGIELTLAAGNLVTTGQRPPAWLSIGQVSDPLELESVSESESDTDIDTAAAEQVDEEAASDEDPQFDANVSLGNTGLSEALSRLATLPISSVQHGPDWLSVRETLSSLQLSRRFLMELTDFKTEGDSGSGIQYAIAMKAYQHARGRMAAANLKLVFHLAKKYLYSGEPLDDLAQEGNIGLLKAVERFDWRRGFKFSTYATWWIRQQIGRHIADKSKTIRVPVHIYDSAQRLARETRAFESEAGRPPELDEISARAGMSSRKVEALQRLAPEPLPIHELPIDDLIAVEAQHRFFLPDPMETVSDIELRKTIDEALTTLKPKEEQVLRLRFGIGVRDAFTLDDIGQRYEVTRERIRQIEAKAIRKLMRPSQMDALSRAAFGVPLRRASRVEEPSNSDGIEQPAALPSMSEIGDAKTARCASDAPSGGKVPKH
jgi:RNA polymerase primary sigma factor